MMGTETELKLQLLKDPPFICVRPASAPWCAVKENPKSEAFATLLRLCISPLPAPTKVHPKSKMW